MNPIDRQFRSQIETSRASASLRVKSLKEIESNRRLEKTATKRTESESEAGAEKEEVTEIETGTETETKARRW